MEKLKKFKIWVSPFFKPKAETQISFIRKVKVNKGSAILTVAYLEGKIEIKKSKYWEIFNKIQELHK